jgi:SAM-dependent methyltransferase
LMRDRADWDELWRTTSIDEKDILGEETTPRWHQIESLVESKLGGFSPLRVIEIGSGHGTNAIHFARRGSHAAVLDNSPEALRGAVKTAEIVGVEIEAINGDAFEPAPELVGAFDVSCSFGLCEHFTGAQRQAIVAAHLAFVREGGVAIIGVPNRRSYPYRLWMDFLKWRGSWLLGTEEPFTSRELVERLREAGGKIVHVGFGSFAATVVGYSVNPFLHNAGRKGFRRPQFKTPLDPFAYELLVIAMKPKPSAGG